VIAWAALSSVSKRPCYAGVAEASIYVATDARGRGVGKALLEKLIEDSQRNGIWSLYGATFADNVASIRMQLACGFRIVGRRERIAQHQGVWRDTIVTERRSKTVGTEDRAGFSAVIESEHMNDDELLRAFEDCTLPYAQWTHRCHVKVAWIYLRRLPYDEALTRLRSGIEQYNAAKSVIESPTTGYNETTTQAFFRLIAATMAAYGKAIPAATADEFCEAHQQLMTQHALRFFYSPAIRTDPRAKSQFIEPDLAPLPAIAQSG
jgi:N-acetylglutamate synthase-like GNAT family acetyltransferase